MNCFLALIVWVGGCMRVFSSRKMETTERREQLETVQTEIISKYSINPFFNSLLRELEKKEGENCE